jgi:4-oxalocrotonate tautomerase
MPIIEVTMVEGRSNEDKRQLMLALTDAAQQSLQIPRDSVRIIVREIPDTHFAAAGVTYAERRAAAAAAKKEAARDFAKT